MGGTVLTDRLKNEILEIGFKALLSEVEDLLVAHLIVKGA
jgi:hypothetical protein